MASDFNDYSGEYRITVNYEGGGWMGAFNVYLEIYDTEVDLCFRAP